MRKSILLIILFCLFTLVTSLASAGPAPNLSNVQITHVGADNTGWIDVKQIPMTTLYGQNFYVAVRFTGYPNPNRIFLYQNGAQIPVEQVTEPFGREGIGNPFTGWVYQFKVPISYGTGIIAVQADGIRTGTYYSTVYGVKAKPQP
ncbi:DUF4879 domain-containing protein [Pelosinus sp. UFO1]|uniref:DUF4879 domain-containing protein n=1 Tax=Pelosinus sp. UFO1 TaxID=484770 RepID=UPI0004D0D2B9|nr:DUF4879 domain-containing protein [Pelosinus sp. UFO1]AIF52784.1 hypothetical protein UFO1_3241 [Pelosinus sp. UFO1]